LLVLW